MERQLRLLGEFPDQKREKSLPPERRCERKGQEGKNLREIIKVVGRKAEQETFITRLSL